MANILRLTVAYLNATINVKPETQNRRLEPTGLAKPGETRGLTGTGPGLAREESAGRVFGRFWNRTDPFLRSKPGPLAGYPDPLLTLTRGDQSGGTTITTSNAASNLSRSSEKGEEMPQELLNWRRTSDPVVVRAKEIETILEQKVWSGP